MSSPETYALMAEGCRFTHDKERGVFYAEDWLPHHAPVLKHLGFTQNASGTWQRLDAVPSPDNYNPKAPGFSSDLWQHQQAAVQLSMERTGSGLWLDMGTGKTRCAIEAMARGKHQRILVVCPKAVIPVWYEQIERWWGFGDLPMPELIRLKGKNSQAKADVLMNLIERCKSKIIKYVAGRRDATAADGVVVINYEIAHLPPIKAALAAWEPDLIVCDEAHRIKGHNSKASQALGKLGPIARRRIALSGTPIANALEDAFGIYRFINPALFGSTWTAFKARYLKMGGPNKAWVVGYRNEEELKAKMATCAIHVKSEDVQDLPDQVDIVRSFELSAKARKAYQEMEQEMLTLVDDAAVEASNALVRMLRLQQLTSGYAKDDEGNLVGQLCTARQEMLAELLEEVPQHEPVVVFYKFDPEIAQIELATKREVFRMNGHVKQLDEWKADVERVDQESDEGVAPVLAVQIDAGGEGVDMTLSHYTVYYSTGFSLSAYEQSRKRTHRPGQAERCFYYHLSASDTIDEAIRKALAAKKDTVEDVMHAMRHGHVAKDENDVEAEAGNDRDVDREPEGEARELRGGGGDGGGLSHPRGAGDDRSEVENPEHVPSRARERFASDLAARSRARDSSRDAHDGATVSGAADTRTQPSPPSEPRSADALARVASEAPSGQVEPTCNDSAAPTLAELAPRYAALRAVKDELAAQAKDNNKAIRTIEAQMREAKEREGVGKSVEFEGIGRITFTNKRDVKVTDEEALIAWLDASGHGEIAKRKAHPATVGKLVRELMDADEEFAAPRCVDISEFLQVSLTKAEKG